MINLARDLSLSVVLLCMNRQTDERKPKFRDEPGSSFVFVRCTAGLTDRRTDGNLASVISLARHLSVSVVQLVPQTDGRKPGFCEKPHLHLSLFVVLLVPQIDGQKPSFRDNQARHLSSSVVQSVA